MNTDADLIQRLGRSNLYNEFKQAFCVSAGLPLTLRPVEFWQLAHRSQPHENPFCAMIAQTNRGCAAYLEAEQSAVDTARSGSATVRCFADLCHTAVPVKLGELRSASCRQARLHWICLQRQALKPSPGNSPTGESPWT